MGITLQVLSQAVVIEDDFMVVVQIVSGNHLDSGIAVIGRGTKKMWRIVGIGFPSPEAYEKGTRMILLHGIDHNEMPAINQILEADAENP